jgi:hypothetical protein
MRLTMNLQDCSRSNNIVGEYHLTIKIGPAPGGQLLTRGGFGLFCVRAVSSNGLAENMRRFIEQFNKHPNTPY